MPCLFDVPGRPTLTYGESGVGMGLEKKGWGAGNCSRDIIYDKRTKKNLYCHLVYWGQALYKDHISKMHYMYV